MHDVIVVGGGFTGLSAAVALRDRGLDILVLEARGRVGGRVESSVNGLGERHDTGGQFLCDDMPEVMALVRRFGRTLVEAPVDGAFIVQPPMPVAAGERLWTESVAIRERLNAIDPADASIAGLSVGQWLQTQPDSDDARSAFQSTIEGLWCQPIDTLPLWHLIDNDRRITNEASELQYFLRETMHALAEDLAAPLGDRLLLDSAVRRISRIAGGVRVATAEAAFDARAVIVAVPPATAGRIAYAQSLPADLMRALAAWHSGTVVKILIRYARPFWRDDGLNGMVMWRDLHGLFACDVSRDDGHAALVAFVGGPLAVRWRDLGDEGLRTRVMERLVAALGPQAGEPLDVSVRDWTGDAWSGGGYSDLVMDVAARDAEAVIRAGVPPIHFACSELSPSFPGYIEGAIVMGRQATAEVITGLEMLRELPQSASATSASGS